ncbi:BrnT family toxin [Azospirillum sp. TSA2s]|nr:BrnT family toxin [Azospirillum sp. TSA2s]
MKITFDPAKRDRTLRERGLDFADSGEVFAGRTIDIPDERFDYGETRIISVGHLRGRMVIVVGTQTEGGRRIISMRKANDREQTRFGQRLCEERLGEG